MPRGSKSCLIFVSAICLRGFGQVPETRFDSGPRAWPSPGIPAYETASNGKSWRWAGEFRIIPGYTIESVVWQSSRHSFGMFGKLQTVA